MMGVVSRSKGGACFATIRHFASIPPPPKSNHPHVPLPNAKGTIIYTETDEAPALATFSLYPLIAKVWLDDSLSSLPETFFV
jgi:hypothetical protein